MVVSPGRLEGAYVAPVSSDRGLIYAGAGHTS